MLSYQSFYLLGFGQGLILCISFLLKTGNSKHKNNYFISLLGLLTLALLTKLTYSPEAYAHFPHLWFFIDTLAYTMGPLWYLSLKHTFKPNNKLDKEELLYLLPILFHLAFLLRISLYSGSSLLEAAREPWFKASFYTFSLTVIGVNASFFIKSTRLLQQSKEVPFPPLLRQVHVAFLSILGLWLGVFCFGFSLREAYPIQEAAYNIAFIGFSLLILGLASLAIIHPAAFSFLTQTYDAEEYRILQELSEKIKRHLASQEAFLRPDYTLSQLAREVGTNSSLASKAINRIMKKSFTDLINHHRVRYFLESVQDKHMAHLTHAAIAEKAGFGNKVSFYKAFKRETGMTPKAYLNQ